MKIYLASTTNYTSMLGINHRAKLQRYLASYHYFGKNVKFFRQAKGDNIEIFLDSGAFSAWSQKKPISMDKYIKFVHECSAYLAVYSVLDDILDYKKTWDNQKFMESNGLDPLPCFHYNEPLSILDRYVESYKYIALGGMVPIPEKQLACWLDEVFHRHPEVKFHGFGMTKINLLKRYPWHTVDSSSWVSGSKFGRVYTMQNEIYFGVNPDTASWSRLNSLEKEHYTKYFALYGIQIQELYDEYKVRNAANVVYFNLIEEQLTLNPPKIFQKTQTEFFNIESLTKKEEPCEQS